MNTNYFSCHMCGSYDSELLMPAILADGSFCEYQQIIVCKKCGLVYKNPVIPELNKHSYTKGSWGGGDSFKKRIADLSEYLVSNLPTSSARRILEIGPGPGWLAMNLLEKFPESKYVLLEASVDVAQLAKKNLPSATVIPSSIDDVDLGEGFASLAIVCGVDYLFPHFRRAMEKITSALEIGGYLYVERNVFVEAEAYAGFPIRSKRDLFGQNALMSTWFSVEQYKAFLECNYDVVSERSFIHDETDGHKCVIRGFLCQKKSDVLSFYDGDQSWYDSNVAALGRLGDTAASCTNKSQQRNSLNRLKKMLSFD